MSRAAAADEVDRTRRSLVISEWPAIGDGREWSERNGEGSRARRVVIMMFFSDE